MDMSPVGSNSNSTPQQLQFVNSTYSPGGSTYTPPSGQPSANYTAPQLATAIVQAQQNQQAEQQSPIGISPKDAGSIASKVLNTASGNTGPGTFSSQIQALDQFGANTLGTGLPVNTATTLSTGFGPTADTISTGFGADGVSSGFGLDATAGANSLTAAPLSGILGAGALGALGGGFLANAVGENSTGGSIGGALGAAAGEAFGAAGAASLGLELGAFAGPVGALVGGIGGALVGGLFGNKTPPTQASAYQTTLNPDGSANKGVATSKNAGGLSNFSTNGVSQFSQMAEGAASTLGIKFDPATQVTVRVSTKHGGAYLNVDGQDIPFDYTSQASAQEAMLQGLQIAAKNSGYTDSAAIQNWYKNIAGGGTNFSPKSAPAIPVSSTFAQFVANKQGQSNGTNATPTI